MPNATVDEILELIDQLPNSERRRLEEELHTRREAEWQTTAAEMQREAAERGIDQTTIDRAVHDHRYGT